LKLDRDGSAEQTPRICFDIGLACQSAFTISLKDWDRLTPTRFSKDTVHELRAQSATGGAGRRQFMHEILTEFDRDGSYWFKVSLIPAARYLPVRVAPLIPST